MGGAYSDWRGHVIVCGLPGVGLRIVEQLMLSGVPAVIVDDAPDPPLARLIGGWGVPLIAGSTRAEETNPAVGRAVKQVGVSVLDVAGCPRRRSSKPACARASRR